MINSMEALVSRARVAAARAKMAAEEAPKGTPHGIIAEESVHSALKQLKFAAIAGSEARARRELERRHGKVAPPSEEDAKSEFDADLAMEESLLHSSGAAVVSKDITLGESAQYEGATMEFFKDAAGQEIVGIGALGVVKTAELMVGALAMLKPDVEIEESEEDGEESPAEHQLGEGPIKHGMSTNNFHCKSNAFQSATLMSERHEGYGANIGVMRFKATISEGASLNKKCALEFHVAAAKQYGNDLLHFASSVRSRVLMRPVEVTLVPALKQLAHFVDEALLDEEKQIERQNAKVKAKMAESQRTAQVAKEATNAAREGRQLVADANKELKALKRNLRTQTKK
jgi:hypothetical protein